MSNVSVTDYQSTCYLQSFDTVDGCQEGHPVSKIPASAIPKSSHVEAFGNGLTWRNLEKK